MNPTINGRKLTKVIGLILVATMLVLVGTSITPVFGSADSSGISAGGSPSFDAKSWGDPEVPRSGADCGKNAYVTEMDSVRHVRSNTKLVTVYKPKFLRERSSTQEAYAKIGGYRLSRKVVLCYGEYRFINNQRETKSYRFKVGHASGSIKLYMKGQGAIYRIYSRRVR